MKEKITLLEMKQIATKRGGQCLSKTIGQVTTKLRWMCANGHIWKATPWNIRSGKWCRICGFRATAEKLRGSIKEMQKIAQSRGGKCLSTEYVNNHTKLTWQCERGHAWEAVPGSIRQGTWCPICGIERRAAAQRGSIEEMRKIAQKRGGKCLSEKYINSQTKLRWQCERGHAWEAVPGSIRQGTWCPECGFEKAVITRPGRFRRSSLAEMQKIAKLRGGRCLATIYENTSTPLKWACSEKHEWEAIPSSIKRGSWCSQCSAGVGERITRAYFEQLFRRKFPTSYPNWLCTKDGVQLELDGYCKDLQLAFEHQGLQHFSYVKFFHSKSSLKKRLTYDRLKRRLCKTHDVTLIEIPGVPDQIEIRKLREYIRTVCQKKGVRLPAHFDRISVDLKGAYSPNFDKYILEMQKIASKKGGCCSSTIYLGSEYRYAFSCKLGHTWKAKMGNIRHGYWCPDCEVIRRKKPRKYSIEKMGALAKALGGKCLSKEYITINTKLTWRCAEGHVWDAIPASVIIGQWCPECAKVNRANKLRGSIEEMRRIARTRGGECLSKTYVNSQTKLKWKCKAGHVWKAIPNSIKKGRWCGICARKKHGNP